MTTSPVREAEPVKCLGERFQDAFLRGWGDDRLVAYADLPAESQAKWNRAALAFVCTLSDAPTELQSALQEAREALTQISVGPLFVATDVNAWAEYATNLARETLGLDTEARALSPGGAEQ